MRRKPNMVYIEEYVAIPMCFYKLQKFLMLGSNVMFVKGTVLLIASSIKLKFVTFKNGHICMADQFSNSLNKVIRLYELVGFILHVILMYVNFRNLIYKFFKVEIIIASEK